MITSTLNETKIQIDYHFLFELSAAFWEMSPLPSPNSWEKDQIQKKVTKKNLLVCLGHRIDCTYYEYTEVFSWILAPELLFSGKFQLAL